MNMRNYSEEHQDNKDRQYAYDFDVVLRRYLLRTLQPYFIVDGATLELGCYKGDMTELILRHFKNVTVVEAAPELANIVRQRFRDRVVVLTSTFEEVSLEKSYENIFLIHTLEHLDNPIEVLDRIRNWLSPTGRLFVAVPNANALSRQIAVRMGVVAYNSAVTAGEAHHGHRRTYSMDVLLNHLHEAKYDVIVHGGVLVKPLANFQFDRAMEQGIVNKAYLDACNELAVIYPDLCASIFAICTHRP